MFKYFGTVRFETYQGADVIMQREIDLKASIVLSCDGLAQCHIWAPYDLEFRVSLLDFRWGIHVNL